MEHLESVAQGLGNVSRPPAEASRYLETFAQGLGAASERLAMSSQGCAETAQGLVEMSEGLETASQGLINNPQRLETTSGSLERAAEGRDSAGDFRRGALTGGWANVLIALALGLAFRSFTYGDAISSPAVT